MILSKCCVCAENDDDDIKQYIACMVCEKRICSTCFDSLIEKWVDVKQELNENVLTNEEDEYICFECYNDKYKDDLGDEMINTMMNDKL